MWSDYADLYDSAQIVGPNSPGFAEMAKALQAGSGAGFGSSGGRALVFEDLESTLRLTTYGEKQYAKTLWRILKDKATEATGIMHEFNQLNAYGDSTTGAFTPEINEGMATQDVDLTRAYAQVAFLRTKAQVSKVTRFTRNAQSPEGLQVLGGTRRLLSSLEVALYNGNQAMVPSEWNGIGVTCDANNNTVNLNGQVLTKQILGLNGALPLVQAQGVPSNLFMPLEVQANLDQQLVGSQDRIVLYGGGVTPEGVPIGYGAAGEGGVDNAVLYGAPAAGIRTSFGNIMFNPHIFTNLRKGPYMARVNGTMQESATSSTAPATPTGAAVAATSTGGGGFNNTGTGGALNASGEYYGSYAGVYYYRIAAENANGESLLCGAVNGTVVSAGFLTLTWTGVAGATCYRIYRSRCGGGASDVQFITRVAHTGASGSTQTYVDNNQNIAGCFTVYLLDLESQGESASVGWAQLAPMSRDMLPPGDTVIQWLQFIYGAFCLYAPLKMIKFKNVGIYTA